MHIRLFVTSLLLGALLIAPAARAQEEPIKVSKWFLPDSPFYMLQRMNEKINTFFTFSDRARAERHWMAAERRFGEYAALANKGKTSLAARAAEEYSEQAARAKESLLRIGGDHGSALFSSFESTLRAKADQMKADLARTPQEAKSVLEHALGGVQSLLRDGAQ